MSSIKPQTNSRPTKGYGQEGVDPRTATCASSGACGTSKPYFMAGNESTERTCCPRFDGHTDGQQWNRESYRLCHPYAWWLLRCTRGGTHKTCLGWRIQVSQSGRLHTNPCLRTLSNPTYCYRTLFLPTFRQSVGSTFESR